MDRSTEDGISLGLINFRTDQSANVSTCTFVFVSYYNISLVNTGHGSHFHCLGLKAMT